MPLQWFPASEAEVENTLSDAGIKRGSKSEHDHERARRIFRVQKLKPDDYDRRIEIAKRYIGIQEG